METSMIRSLVLFCGLCCLVLAAGCSQDASRRGAAIAPKPLATQIITDQIPGSSFPADGQWQCVPYARAVSGIELYGDAWTWWARAEGKFTRAQTPVRGAVLVFARGEKLRLGHLAVVISIKNAREIETTDANWGSAAETRGHVHDEQLIQDVSADNSWRQVRVWNRKAKVWGRPYETYGFIYPPKAWGPPRCALPDGSVGLCPNS
jgi:hypothetical protein